MNFGKAFEQKTGIKVNVVEAKGDKLLARIKAEGANSPADVLITVDAGRLAKADSYGLFAPVQSPIPSPRFHPPLPQRCHHLPLQALHHRVRQRP